MPGAECSHLGEVMPDVTLVPTISLKCRRELSSSNKVLTAGTAGMPEKRNEAFLTQDGSKSGLCIHLCPQHPFLRFQKGDPSSPKFIRGGFPIPLIKYYRQPHDAWLHL